MGGPGYAGPAAAKSPGPGGLTRPLVSSQALIWRRVSAGDKGIMAKEVTAVIRLQVPAGQATPAPPVGPALGQHGVNIGQFVSQFNEKTRDQTGTIIPVVITAYKDRTFSFIMKSPPAAALLKQAAGIVKGSGTPNKEKVGKVTRAQVREIAKRKMVDLNARTMEAAEKVVEGAARSMGVEIVEG